MSKAPTKEEFLAILTEGKHVGIDNAISSDDIARRLSFRPEGPARRVGHHVAGVFTKLASQLSDEGHVVVGCSQGYFLAASREECMERVRVAEAAAKKAQATADKWRNLSEGLDLATQVAVAQADALFGTEDDAPDAYQIDAVRSSLKNSLLAVGVKLVYTS